MGIIRLSAAGAGIVDQLFAGQPIGEVATHADLAARLVDRGMAHPLPSQRTPPGQVTVIIPVKDDLDGLELTIRSLPEVAGIVVIDDASLQPVTVADELTTTPLVILRNQETLGPGRSRNRGLETVETPFVLFIDAGVGIDDGGRAEGDAIGSLLRYFCDDQMVAVGPRITAPPAARGNGILNRYERDHSPLDLGPRPSPVRPGAAVPYLPTACLLVRRHALREVGPFDPALRYGEDVDLVWRLRTVGSVRYVPAVIVTHPSRSSLRCFVRQRIGYGSAAGPLGLRHGAAVAPLRSSGWTLGVLGLALTGHPVLAVVTHGATTRALVPKLGLVRDPLAEATRLTTIGNLWAARTLARSAVRTWWPLLLLGAVLPITRSVSLRWLRWTVAERLMAERTVADRRVDPRQLAVGLLDDVSYGTGVWLGALRSRSLVALMPATSGQSISGRFTIKSSNWTTPRVSILRRRIWDLRSSWSLTTAIGKCDG